MKKSKLFFIITATFILITIGCLFYKNNCNTEYNEYMNKNRATDIELKWHSIDKSEYNRIQEKKATLSKASNMADNIFIISGGLTLAFFTTGIVFKVKEKKKIK